MAVIAWDSVCGNTSLFWDSDATWNTDHPSIPECFQKTALIWGSFGFLWLMLPAEIYVVISSRSRYIPLSVLNTTKMVVNVCLILLAVVEFSNALNIHSQGWSMLSADIYNPVIKSLTFILCLVLVHIERLQGIQSSGVLFTFWLMLSLIESVTFVSLLIDVFKPLAFVSEPHFLVHMFYFPLMVFQCFLATFKDVKPQYRDVDDVAENACPKNRASFASKLVFFWLDGLLKKAYEMRLTSRDVWKSSSEVLCRNTVHIFQERWQYADDNQAIWPLWRVIASIHKTKLLIATLLILMSDILIYVNPIILDLFIKFVSSNEPTWHGLAYAFTLFLTTFATSLFNWHAVFMGTSIAVGVQSSVASAIYRKALVLSNMSKHVTSLGQYVNLIGVDACRLSDFLQYFTYCVSLPVQLAIGVWMLYARLGQAAFVGIALLLVLNLLSIFLASRNRALQTLQLKEKDNRIKLINEAISGIKLLKLLAWEKISMSKIDEVRERELRVLRKAMYLNSATTFIWSVAPYAVTLATLAFYVFIDENHYLDPSKIFVTITILNILRLPMAHLPAFIAIFVQTVVSVTRLSDFLSSDELDTSSVSHCSVPESVIISDGWFSWGKTENCILKDINVRLDQRRSVAIVGRVGVGKTSLLAAILGEMNRMHGAVNVNGSTAYVSQTAWILNATLKENIVFGKTYREDVYRRVIRACALDAELNDDTEIGEKGVTLSGGQRQRVSLARAVYAQADLYLMDDPLGALDARVARQVYENVLGPRGILKEKTLIMVMNGTNFLDEMDTVLFVNNGTIAESGTWNELLANGSAALNQLIDEQQRTGAATTDNETVTDKQEDGQIPLLTSVGDSQYSSEEIIAEGRVRLTTYLSYWNRVGFCLGVIVCVCLLLSYVFYTATSVWLSEWSMDYKRPEAENQETRLKGIRMAVYAALGSAYGLFLLIGSFAIVDGGIRASRAFHDGMLLNVMRSPMSFFDCTPSGRIINRFSKDIDSIDTKLQGSFRGYMYAILEITSGLVLICINVPAFLAVVAPLAVVYYFIQRYYVATVDQLKRLESKTRSHLYSHLSESYHGLSTLRAYRRQQKFIREFEELLDENLKHLYYTKTVFRWVGIRLDIVGNIIVLATTLFGIYQRNSMDPGTIAMLVTFAISINFTFTALVQSSGVLVSNIVSVERINEYTNLTEEAPWSGLGPRKIDDYWPEFGTISFRDVCLKYRDDLGPAVNKFSCNIKAGEKIVIVGRTGSGKTTLVHSLVRLLEPTSGSITIDGVDISSIGLHELRSRINVIPQDPTLFAGSLRLNLDPLNQHDDETLWKILQQTNLSSFVESLPNKLHTDILSAGENLSVGQRQLICLSRAMLRKTFNILILDEATSSLDAATENLVMSVMKREFARATILTISHRLTSVMECDRVMVIDNGYLIEFDTPQHLLAKETSIFQSLVKAANLNRPSQEDVNANE